MALPRPFPDVTVIVSPEEERKLYNIARGKEMVILYGYAVTIDGRIFSIRGPKPRELKGHITANGHKLVTLQINGKGMGWFVHRLVAYAFHGPPPRSDMVTRHLDGNPLNNHADNLAWGTMLQNALDAIRHGTRPRGEKAARARLTPEKVYTIRERIAAGESNASIARDYGVSRQAIWQIKYGVTWQHLP